MRSHPAAPRVPQRWRLPGAAVFAAQLATLLLASAAASGNPAVVRDALSDHWTATDALGRRLPSAEECGPPRPGKQVGIFYFLWHGAHGEEGPFDLTQIVASDPDNPPFGPPGAFHHWGEPELGYYLSDDEYVFRQHAVWLSDAGVDVIAIDVSNAELYQSQFEKLCSVWLALRAEGGRTPQVMFLAHTREAETVTRLYEAYYRDGRFRELWFLWQGKPLMLASPDQLAEEVRSFFTFRKTWAWTATNWFGDGLGKWTWLDHTPQQPGLSPSGEGEEGSVAVAQHATTNIGRSFSRGSQPPPHGRRTEEGVFFQEQWERALAIDPPFVFITGWNEWVAQRFVCDDKNCSQMLGKTLKPGDSYFVDCYSQEFSRDIEPMRGGHADNYYYQMIAGIRRFKGVQSLPLEKAPSPVAIDGAFDDWASVHPEFQDTVGDAGERTSRGWGSTGELMRPGGVIDFESLKAEAVGISLSFYLKGRSKLPFGAGLADDPNLWLLLDSDSNASTGSNGYDYRVGFRSQNGSREELLPYLQRFDPINGWIEAGDAEVAAAVSERELELSLPAAALGLGSGWIEFKWIEGLPSEADYGNVTSGGDQAPNRRANFRLFAQFAENGD